jgi:hypothetical protein
MRRFVARALLLGLACSAPACVTRQPIEGQEVSGLDRKLSAHAWVEEGKLVTLIVGTLSARDKDGSPYVPFEIAVSNNGLRQLSLTRESFTLVDQEGNRYPVAGPRELIEGYDRMDFDRRMGELEGIIFSRFSTYTRYPSNFSPSLEVHRASNVVRDLVSLPRFGYMVDFLFFPAPSTGVRDRRFELFLDSADLEEPIFVKFEVR